MMTVLLIDDSEDEFILLSQALHRLDKCMKCVHAYSPGSALGILKNFSPRYIFIGLDMNGTTGMGCIARIRMLGELRETPVVVYPAAIGELQWENAKKSGANGHVEKTARLAVLIENLDSFFRFQHVFFR